jgi:phospholipid/cholesterol/gamma-HCH transport system permease protein
MLQVKEPFLKATLRGDGLELTASGPWTVENAPHIEELIGQLGRDWGVRRRVAIDVGSIERFDTFGAWLLERLLRGWTAEGCATEVRNLSDTYRELMEEVRHSNMVALGAPRREGALLTTLERVGRTMVDAGRDLVLIVQMFGEVAVACLRVAARPRRLRVTSLVYQLERVGWRAVPIVVLITFLVGCILAQQGLFNFRKFGADVYVVDLIGILVLRELGVLIVSIMVAGRSGSAYTAELGSMRMREEIDALRTMGLDPTEILVLPRILALVIAVPLLTFLGSMAALYGGGLVSWVYGGINPDIFLSRLKESIDLDTFAVGMFKAPFMALIIGVVACVEGYQVEGSAQSLGLRTTASVVKSIFLVIVIDGLFAVFFAAVGM